MRVFPMTFEIFVQCFKDKEPAYYPRSMVEEIFKRAAVVASDDLSEVRYADGYAMIDGIEDNEISDLVLASFGGRIALERLLEFADKTGAFIAWAGTETNLAVTRADVIRHIPDEFTDDGDTIAVVANVDEFLEVAEIVLP